MGRPTDNTRRSTELGKDPATGEELTELLNPLVIGSEETDLTDDDRRQLFEENLEWQTLDQVKEMFLDWRSLTHPGDDWPKVRKKLVSDAPPVSETIKGESLVLADTNDDDWLDKFVDGVNRNA